MKHPKTVDEWQIYISTLEGTPLYSQAINVNSMEGLRQLQREGYSADDITKILTMFARQFGLTGQAVPGGCYTSFAQLLRDAPGEGVP